MLKLNNDKIEINYFPDGTQRLKIEEFQKINVIEWFYEKEEELSTLIYITRHLKNVISNCRIVLKVAYLPNARMDRIHDKSEVFTLKGFADVINWLGFEQVYVLDIHSNVGTALIDRVHTESAFRYIWEAINTIKDDKLILYFPDEGAAKRYSDMFPEMVYCYGEKKRDWETGKILGLNIKTNGINLEGSTILMIDDIVSYGGSLYYSSKELKKCGAGKIYAYATHTENSILDTEKGTLIKALEDNTVERLFTTNSLFTGEHQKITVMEEEEWLDL